MHICEKCLLNDNIPSVKVDSNGLCNYCNTPKAVQNQHTDMADEEFASLLKKYKNRKYQVIMAYSGGKDSTYTLKMIKEKYNASILAVTFNNGFLSESSVDNINNVTDHLGVDSIIVKYPADKMISAYRFVEDGRAFPRASLERASAICNLCIMLIKNMIYHEAIIRDIPIICFGWTPGQVETAKPLIKLNYQMVCKGFENIRNAVIGSLGSEYDRYFLDMEFMKENEERMPYLYYPFVSNSYDEKSIFDEIGNIGWKLPENTDGNSSNCLLNSYANQSHIERFGYHPYAFEISNLIRAGYMSKAEGLEKLDKVKNDNTFMMIQEKFCVNGKT